MTGQADGAVGAQIGQVADGLRALAANGLVYGKDPYDIERFHRVRSLAAELMAIVDTRTVEDIGRIFQADLDYRTPTVAVDAAIFDERDRVLLVQRADSGMWCLPGGAADVGESPSAAAEREAREETGLTVRASRLIGLFDNRTFGVPSVVSHAYYIVFECDLVGGELRRSIETSDFRWATEPEAVALELYRSHVYKVPAAFRMHRDPGAGAAFH
jgi:ADP-ribose pyrophosphatase YjhB (NUDIX family)